MAQAYESKTGTVKIESNDGNFKNGNIKTVYYTGKQEVAIQVIKLIEKKRNAEYKWLNLKKKGLIEQSYAKYEYQQDHQDSQKL